MPAIDVKDAVYYHINSNANMSPHGILRRDQEINVGAETSPFFRFYEANSRTYKVTENPSGNVVDVPAMTFLRSVRDGRVQCPNFPPVAFDVANHFLMLARELLWENVRLTDFKNDNLPSRQRCMWLIKEEANLALWKRTMNLAPMAAAWPIKVRVTGRVLDYWRGEMTTDPRPETLFMGRLKVEEILNWPPAA